MTSTNDPGAVADPASGRASHIHRLRGLAVTGFVATLAAIVATTVAAALAQAVGVEFEIPDGGEKIPLPGFAVVTGFFSLVGIVIAAALLRWSARPAERFLWAAVSLTAISFIPPLISGADTATSAALLGLHLVPAAVMIPAPVRSLRSRTADRARVERILAEDPYHTTPGVEVTSVREWSPVVGPDQPGRP
ncbi:DUF6069 family protein [Micromonospora avicenniae]|uniref:DUF6069 family protein n=1 Tax=Micromonospora avicenniae TaxID=1198245 RepID=UPI0033323D85